MSILGNADQSLNILVKMKDEASKALSNLNTNVEKLQPTFKKMSTAGTLAFAGISAVVGASIREFAKFEQAEVAFSSMLGSAEEAKDMIGELSRFSAKTPFQFEDIVQATRTLVAFGDTGKGAIDKLGFLGDIAAGAQVPLAELAQIFGKVQTKGKAMTEEILQMAERGIPIIDELAKQFNVTKDEIFKMASAGTITADVVEQALRNMTGEGAIFADQMAKQSETISGLFSTLKDNIQLTAAAVGEVFSEDASKMIEKSIEIVARLKEWIEQNPKLVKTIIVIAGALAGLVAVLGTVGIIAGAVATGFAIIFGGAVMSGIMLVVGALMVMYGVFQLIKERWDDFANGWRESIDAARVSFELAGERIDAIWKKMGSGVQALKEMFIGAFKEIGSFISGLFGGLGNLFIGMINTVIKGLNALSFKMPSWLGGKSFSLNIPLLEKFELPKFEHGGIVPGAPGTAVPIMAHAGEQIIPAINSKANQGVTLNLTINNPSVRSDRDIDSIKKLVMDSFRELVRDNKLATI